MLESEALPRTPIALEIKKPRAFKQGVEPLKNEDAYTKNRIQSLIHLT